jgi:hypothetical protein
MDSDIIVGAMSFGTAFFEVETRDPAQALCRVLGFFAQQCLPLASVFAHSANGRMHMMLRAGAIEEQRASVLAHKIRALAIVENVDLTFSAAGSVPPGRLRRAQDAQDIAAGHLADVGG